MQDMKRIARLRLAGLVALLALLAAAPPLGALTVTVRPVLHWAAENGLTEIARQLLDQGSDVNARDNFSNTPLHLAARLPEMLELLLSRGAQPGARNAFGNTPLHLAVGNRRAVELLLAAGADARVRNLFDKTPLDYSLRGGTSAYNLGIVTLLIKAGP
jgi:ankyrin repeat protein